jgi:hypothetical protein
MSIREESEITPPETAELIKDQSPLTNHVYFITPAPDNGKKQQLS